MMHFLKKLSQKLKFCFAFRNEILTGKNLFRETENKNKNGTLGERIMINF